jgi:hypothetical protein
MQLAFAFFALQSAATASAQTIDYVQCREMLRTKNQLIRTSAEREARHSTPMPPECMEGMFTAEQKERCAFAWKQNQPKPMEIGGIQFYSVEAYTLFKSSLKVADDMKKAGCPYQ